MISAGISTRDQRRALAIAITVMVGCGGASTAPPDARVDLAPIVDGRADQSHDSKLTPDLPTGPDLPTCVPSELSKASCPPGGSAPCGAGAACRDQTSCKTVSCTGGPACTAAQGAYALTIRPTASSAFPPAPFDFFATLSLSATSDELTLTDSTGNAFTLQWTLPAAVTLPVVDGMDVSVHACLAGTPINTAWVLVVRDKAGKLLFAGGSGGRVLSSSCWGKVLTVQRQDLGCEPRQELIDPVTTGFVENFAVRLYGDAGSFVSLDLDAPQATLTRAGVTLRAVLLDARHTLEWTGTDLAPPYEGLLIVPE